MIENKLMSDLGMQHVEASDIVFSQWDSSSNKPNAMHAPWKVS